MEEAFRVFINRLHPCPPADLDAFAALFAPRLLPKHAYFQREGEPCRQLAFVGTGYLRGFYTKDGTEITSNFIFGPSFAMDYYGYSTRTPATLNLEALTASELLVCEFAQLEELAGRSLAISTIYRLFISHLYNFNHQRNRSFIYETPEERYRKLALERPKVLAHIPQHYIASYLGITPTSLSRIRRRLAAPQHTVSA